MSDNPTTLFNLADYYLDDRIREGRGERVALRGPFGTRTYAEVQELANRFAEVIAGAGVRAEERVIVALPDAPEFVGALFGILKVGAVVVMVNNKLPAEDLRWFCQFSRASLAIVDAEVGDVFDTEQRESTSLRTVITVGGEGSRWDRLVQDTHGTWENAATHRDEAAIWLFSGGTTGRPKAVVQNHRAFANTTELYGKGVLGLQESDITISVPKLYFGYATGSNLFFPFAVGGSTVLFPEKCTADAMLHHIGVHRPTVCINVPTMIHRMLEHPDASPEVLASLRLATSAGEALPAELHAQWDERLGVPLLDGLGTAEMWHVFLSNRPDDIRPGTLGKPVPGFDVRVRDEDGNDLPDGEPGRMWVRGDSRALWYWQDMERSQQAFMGRWYVSGDLVMRDADGYHHYCGRADDLLKVGGRWVAPQEVEGCLLTHPTVHECAVVGIADSQGLTKPHAFVVCVDPPREGLEEELKRWVKERLEPYKYPREVQFMDILPRTHLGKVDRGKLQRSGAS